MSNDTQPVIIVTGADRRNKPSTCSRATKSSTRARRPPKTTRWPRAARTTPWPSSCATAQGGRSGDGRGPRAQGYLQHGAGGTDTIDKVAAKARGIEVVAAVGANAAAVAEQALAPLLACAKSVVGAGCSTHAGHWDKATHKSLELGGRTVGQAWVPLACALPRWPTLWACA